MQVTSNFDMQKKDYHEVAPHNHRIKSKTKNNNIDWSLTKYDILNQHPVDFKKLMITHWGVYAFTHDLKRIKSGHINDTYGDYTRPELRALQSKVLNSIPNVKKSYRLFKKKLPELQTRYHASELLKSVQGMFQRKNKTGYRTIETGFARGTNHGKQLGSDRQQIWQKIKKAYPELSDGVILQSEARGLNRVPEKMNQMMPGFEITDYDVHVDEKKHYFGQAHLQGRMALLGKTKKGKPSFNLNNSIKTSVIPHKDLLKHLDKKYYPENFGTKKDHMNFNNNVGRFHAFNMLASYITFKTVSLQLEHDFPRAKLNFHLIRTYAPSVNHNEYIRQQDQERRTSSAIDRTISKAKQHLQRSYAQYYKNFNSLRSSVQSSSKNIESSSASISKATSSLDDYANNVEYNRDQIISYGIIKLESAFNTLDSNHNKKDSDYQFKANYDFEHGLSDKDGTFSNMALVARETSLADYAKSKAYSTSQHDLQNKTSTFNQREVKQYQSALDVIKPKDSLSASYYYNYGSTVSIHGKVSTAYGYSAAEMSISKADSLTQKRNRKAQQDLQDKIDEINRKQKQIKEFKVARRKMMQQQFSLIVPKSYKIKGKSRKQIINEMVQGVGFKGNQLGDNKFHKGFDLEVHFVGYDLQHGLDANVQKAKNEIDDYEKNSPQK